MKIMYPKMVERAFNIIKSEAPLNMAKENEIKADIYREMVKKGVLDENGQPTQLAFDKGFVDRAQTLAEFKQEFPQLKEYADSHFKYVGDGWGIDNYVMRSMANKALKASSNEYERQRALDALRQVDEVEKEYFNNEN